MVGAEQRAHVLYSYREVYRCREICLALKPDRGVGRLAGHEGDCGRISGYGEVRVCWGWRRLRGRIVCLHPVEIVVCLPRGQSLDIDQLGVSWSCIRLGV